MVSSLNSLFNPVKLSIFVLTLIVVVFAGLNLLLHCTKTGTEIHCYQKVAAACLRNNYIVATSPCGSGRGAGGVNDSMCVTHRWLFERRTIVDGPFFLSSPPPPPPPLLSPPHPLPPCMRQQSETTTLGSFWTWDARGLSHSPLRGQQHLGTHRLWGWGWGISQSTQRTTHGNSELGYVGFIPQSTERTMTFGNS